MKGTIFKFGALCVLTAALSGCGYTVEQLVKDDALRHKVLKDCATMGLKAKDDKNCRVAAEAQVQATGDAVKGLLK